MNENQSKALLCAVYDLIAAIKCARAPGEYEYDWESARDTIDDILQHFPEFELSDDVMENFQAACDHWLDMYDECEVSDES